VFSFDLLVNGGYMEEVIMRKSLEVIILILDRISMRTDRQIAENGQLDI
jgi:hypothetical protein